MQKTELKLIIKSFSPSSSPLHSSLSLSSLGLLHLLPPCPAMLLSWLRVLVYDWVTLLYLWSFLWLSIFAYMLAPPSMYLYVFIYMSLHLFFACCALCCLFAYYFTSLFAPSWLPHFVILPAYLLPATAIIYLLSQLHIFFPARSLTHWFCLIL